MFRLPKITFFKNMEEDTDAALLCTLQDTNEVEDEERHRKWMAQGKWIESLKLVEVTKLKGNFWKNVGFNSKGTNYLYPEEALFLCEKKQLSVELDEKVLEMRVFYDLVLGSMPYPCYLSYMRLKVNSEAAVCAICFNGEYLWSEENVSW